MHLTATRKVSFSTIPTNKLCHNQTLYLSIRASIQKSEQRFKILSRMEQIGIFPFRVFIDKIKKINHVNLQNLEILLFKRVPGYNKEI